MTTTSDDSSSAVRLTLQVDNKSDLPIFLQGRVSWKKKKKHGCVCVCVCVLLISLSDICSYIDYIERSSLASLARDEFHGMKAYNYFHCNKSLTSSSCVAVSFFFPLFTLVYTSMVNTHKINHIYSIQFRLLQY
jgi:hypothetical protein